MGIEVYGWGYGQRVSVVGRAILRFVPALDQSVEVILLSRHLPRQVPVRVKGLEFGVWDLGFGV